MTTGCLQLVMGPDLMASSYCPGFCLVVWGKKKKQSCGTIPPMKVGQNLFTGYFMKVRVLVWPYSST